MRLRISIRGRVRSFVRPSVRPFAKIACFVIGLKSRELASRVNTKAICEKMTKKRSFFSRISIGVRIVASPSLDHHFSEIPVRKTRKIQRGGCLKLKKWLFV